MRPSQKALSYTVKIDSPVKQQNECTYHHKYSMQYKRHQIRVFRHGFGCQACERWKYCQSKSPKCQLSANVTAAEGSFPCSDHTRCS